MRPHDSQLNPEAELPEWLLALQQAVSDDKADRPTHVLLPGAAMDELSLLQRLTPPEAAEDRSSLQVDIGESLDGLGAELVGYADTAISDFRRDTLSRITDLLSTREGIQVAAAAGAVLKARLASAGGVKAAWRDVVNAFETDASYEECLSLLGVLRELVEIRGHAWEAEMERITRIINDSAAHARQAGADIPLPEEEHGRPPVWTREAPAGLSETERLGLVESDLARPASDEELVVWLLIEDAFVRDRVVELGPVRFIDVRHFRSRAEVAPQLFDGLGLPSGYELETAQELLSSVELDASAVLVRVEASGARESAVDWARRAVTSLLDVATLGEERFGWNLAKGYYVTFGHGRLWQMFGSSSDDPRQLFHRFSSRPDIRLAAVDPGLIAAWVDGRPSAEEAVDLARWERALSLSTDESFRVALGIRNLERVLPQARVGSGQGRGARWTRVVRYYLKDVWCWTSLEDQLQEICFHAVSPAMRPFRDGSDLRIDDNHIHDFYEAIKGLVGAESPTPSQLIANAAAIAALMPLGSSRRRILEMVVRSSSTSPAAQAWMAQFGRQFDVLLARAARQRNAAVHGGATVPAVIETVSPFVADLGTRVVKGAMTASADDVPLPIWFEQTRLKAREKMTLLESGMDLSEIVER